MRLPGDFTNWLDHHANVFTWSNAIDCGVSPQQFRTGTSRGDWVRFRGVWIMTHAARDRRALSWAALLKGGPAARLTGVTAVSCYGLEAVRFQVHIAMPTATRIAIPQATVLRDKFTVGAGQLSRGFPVVSRQRAVVDALRILDEAAGRSLLFEALRLRWVSVDDLEDWVARLKGHNRVGMLRQQISTARSGTRADSELVLQRIIQRARLGGWLFNHEIRAHDGRLIAIGDCVHREARVVIEVDGMAWHSTAERFQRDRSRQNALVNEGWHVLRFTWTDLVDRPRDVRAEIRKALRISRLRLPIAVAQQQ